ncbi:MAG: LysR family transcriptional regulator [Cohaesibacteraceae bacterium]|nr:LysR family transcriptional regulator [Cohaesibacteraceae bacterium]
MNFQQLESFRQVAALNSFTRAADRLNTTQSTISVRISELELELGVSLLDRSRRKIQLTPRGQELLKYATEIHLLVTELKARISNPEMVPGTIRLGVAELIAVTWLPNLVSELGRLFSKLTIDMEVGLSGDMFDKLAEGEIDLCLLPADEHMRPKLTTIPLGSIQFAYMASPRLGLQGRCMSPKELESWPLISLGPSSILSGIQERWFHQQNAQMPGDDKSNSMEINAGLVRSGLGISFLPVEYYADDIRAGKMVVLNVNPPFPPVKFYAVHGHNCSPTLIDKIVQIVGQVGEFMDIEIDD